MGWPQAAVQLGSAISYYAARRNLSEFKLADWAAIEGVYLEILSRKYSRQAFLGFFNSHPTGLRKLLLLSLFPHSVHQDEPINGGNLTTLRKYGVVDLVPDERSHQTNQRYFVRMSLPLLNIINDGIVPRALLFTCRESYATIQEQAQLYSLAICFNALCTLKHEPLPITLRNLRPGADVYGNDKGVLDRPLVSPEEVEQALQREQPIEMQVVKQGMKLPGPPLATCTKTHEEAIDSYAIFTEGKYVMQSKGSQLGHALQRSIPPSDVAKVFKQLAQKAPDALALEFLSSRSAPSRYSTLPSLLNPEKHAFVFISRETLPEALHPCFANIASRASSMERPRRVQPRRRGSKTDLA
ncbi:hypothetical protein QOT17_010567 [Balamuthia mandrillaris]